MTNDELIEYCRQSIEKNDYIAFDEATFSALTEDSAKYIASLFAADTFILLPQFEIDFFEWLKKEDFPVWQDLWGDVTLQPYLVGASFLPMLVRKDGRGFPICDLQDIDNYYFSMAHMPDEESKLIIESSKTRFQNKSGLTVAHLLALEISMDPIDIWHFTFKHGANLSDAKKAVAELVEDKAIVHLTKSEHLAVFLVLND